MKTMSLLLIGLGLIVSPLAAQEIQDAEINGWSVSNIRDLYTELGEEPLRGQVLAPDGSAIAWIADESLCVYSLIDADAEPECTEFPPDTALNTAGLRFNPLAWSYDGAYIVLTFDFFRYFIEPDLYLYDVAAREFAVLTEDRIYDFLDEPEALVDVLPMWNPNDSTQFYFMRLQRDQSMTVQLYDVDDQSITPVFTFPLDFGSIPFIASVPVLDPSGEKIVFTFNGGDDLPEQNGIWVLDLITNELKQAAEMSDLTEVLVDWLQAETLRIESVAWTQSSLLVTMVSNLYFVRSAVYIDLESGVVTGVIDYTAYSTRADLLEGDQAPLQPTYFAVPDDGSVLFALAQSLTEEGAALLAYPLPPDSSEPVRLLDLPDPLVHTRYALGQTENQYAQSITSAHQVLIGGYLYTFDAPQTSMFGS